MTGWDHKADIVILGSGAAGLGAALAAHELGLRPLVLEAQKLVGGSSALAGGGMWIPCNRFMAADGEPDSEEAALRYMDELIGDEPPASSRTRKEAFVRNAPNALEFLESCGMEFRRTTGYPDYFPDVPGGSTVGRGVESVVFDTKKLGEWADALPPRRFPRNLPMGTLDVALIVLAKRNPRGLARLGRIYAHHFASKARGQKLAGGGGALVAQLLHQCVRRDIPIWRETRAVELVLEDGRPVGVVIERDGRRERVQAERAVHLAAGGFARNDELRQQHQRHPISAKWTSAHPGDLGDGLRLGLSAGAATALLDEAWWGPSSFLPPEGPAIFHVSERSKPGSLIVDGSGVRYFNESMDYVLAGQTMFDRHAEVPAIPSYLIFDQRYRNRYPFGANLPGKTPQELIDNGYFKRADTIEELARLCDLPAEQLRATVDRFNGFARAGRDDDFHRGENAYDTYYGDPGVKPNACLAPIEKGPFYAVALYPGDLGTKGGLVTDEHGRVLREDGTAIEGLYSSGNTSASVMGRRYPGPGVTLAPALTFSWLAMRHAAGAPVGAPAGAPLSPAA
ncbi:MAG: 3-ketosteroid dehydrogenase [Conexibacter sp.]|nr:3-ketosteroid dehydrogenase [Conexibacter sp.]